AYTNFTDALERCKFSAAASRASDLAERIVKNPPTQEEFDQYFYNLQDQYRQGGVVVRQGDLDAAARNLHGTMIYQNWSYTITYFTVKISYEAMKKTALFAVDVISAMISSGYI